jgi:hypothetical protein
LGLYGAPLPLSDCSPRLACPPDCPPPLLYPQDLRFWAVGWTDWNLVLSTQGGPNHLKNLCDANIIVDASNKLNKGTLIMQARGGLGGSRVGRWYRAGSGQGQAGHQGAGTERKGSPSAALVWLSQHSLRSPPPLPAPGLLLFHGPLLPLHPARFPPHQAEQLGGRAYAAHHGRRCQER